MLELATKLAANRRRMALIGVTLAALAAGVLYTFNPLQQLGWLRCPFELTTGLFCPGCGSLRATHALLHGDLPGALDLNLLAVIALPVLLTIGLIALYRMLRGESFVLRVPPVIAWSIFYAIILFTILRNLPLEFLHWLRP